MGRAIFEISMSLDGFVRAANPTADEPLGKNGEHLHDWIGEDDEAGTKILEAGIAAGGAMICGRKTYEDSLRWWQADGPSGPARLPLFVVTHDPPKESPANGVYHFVQEGIAAALAQAKAVAGGKNVMIMGGPTMGRAYLQAGLVDDVWIHVAPVMFGAGLRLFEQDDEDLHVQLGRPEVSETAKAVHLRYQVR